MTPSIRSASRGSARSELSASRRPLRTRFTTRLESACATYRSLSISYDCNRQEGPKTGAVGGPRSRRLLPLGPLLGSIEQGRLQGGVEIPTHLRHTLIAILAKEARRLVVFKYSPAFIVLKQNHSERRIKSSRELMASHF